MSEARIDFYGADEPRNDLNARINRREVALAAGLTLRQAIREERGEPINDNVVAYFDLPCPKHE